MKIDQLDNNMGVQRIPEVSSKVHSGSTGAGTGTGTGTGTGIETVSDNSSTSVNRNGWNGLHASVASKSEAEILESLKVELSDHNIAVTRLLYEYGLPVTKELLNTINEFIRALPGFGVEHATLLASGGITGIIGNEQTLLDILDGNFNLSDSLSELTQIINSSGNPHLIESYAKALIMHNASETLNGIDLLTINFDTNNPFLANMSINSDSISEGIITSDATLAGATSSGAIPDGATPSGDTHSETIPSEVTLSSATPSGDMPSGTAHSGTAPSDALPSGVMENVFPLLSKANATFSLAIAEVFSDVIQSASKGEHLQDLSSRFVNALNEVKEANEKKDGNEGKVVNEEKVGNEVNAGKEYVPVSDKPMVMEGYGKELEGLFYTLLNGLFDSDNHKYPGNQFHAGNLDEAKSLLSEEWNKLYNQGFFANKQIIEKLFGSLHLNMQNANSGSISRELDYGSEIKKQYEHLIIRLSILKNIALNAEFANREILLHKLEITANSARFINDINNQHLYMQIPLSIDSSERNSNAELFIMKRGGKRKKINPDDATLLVALNTNNIGRVESLIHVKNKNVSLNIRAENDSIISVLKEGSTYLHNALSDRGYKLSRATFAISEKRVSASNAIKEANKNFRLVGQSVLDYRI